MSGRAGFHIPLALGAAVLAHSSLRLVMPAGPAPALPVDESAGALAEIVVHHTPAADFVRATYRDFFAALPGEVRVHVVCEGPEEFEDWTRLTGREATPVHVGEAITPWSRDRFLACGDTLIVPPEPHAGGPERKSDWLAPFRLADATDREAHRAPFRFDGGDFCAAGGRMLCTSTWTARNPDREPAALVAQAEELFGVPLLHLEDAPDHHIGMVLAPLPDGRILVGDARRGASLAPAELEVDASEATARRFDAVAERLEREGYEVLRLPVVATLQDFAWLSYTNVILEDGVVYLPRYGFEALDEAAARVYRELGLEVRPIDLTDVWRHGGALRCLVHVLDRGPSRI